MNVETLHILGNQNLPVPNTYYRNDTSNHLAILLPGLGYNLSKPYMYYSSFVMQVKNADILEVAYDYTSSTFETMSANDLYEWLIADCQAAYKQAIKQKAYEHITLIGKSLGTLALGYLLQTEANLKHATWIWLTPLLKNPVLSQQLQSRSHKSLYVIGTLDKHFEKLPLLKWKEQLVANGWFLKMQGIV